jgi:hypothetical protein
MNETMMMALAWGLGAMLGVVFFGGLWWTVRKSLYSKHPALWIFSGRHWGRLLLCLLGFIAARFAVIRLTRPSGHDQTGPAQEATHAP